MGLASFMKDRVTLRQLDRSRVVSFRTRVFGTPVDHPNWITRDEAAQIADRRTPRTIDRWVQEGRVTVYRGPVPPHPNTGRADNHGVRVWRPDVLEQAGKVEL